MMIKMRRSRLASRGPRISLGRAAVPLVAAIMGYLILPSLLAGLLPAPEVASASLQFS